MKYEKVFIIEEYQKDTDELGNAVMDYRTVISPYSARMSSHCSENVDMDDVRTVTEQAPEIWTDVPPWKLYEVAGLEISGVKYQITAVYPYQRGGWALVQLEHWGDKRG